MFETNFGIEIEFSGITRKEAAEIVAKIVNGTVIGYDIRGADRREWKIVYDSSVSGYRRQGNRLVPTTNSEYQCELVSPILIHLNAGGGTGTEVWHEDGSAQSQKFANSLVTRLAALGYRNRGVKNDKTSRFGSFGILRGTKAPAVLAEICFIDSAADMKIFDANKVAAALAEGISAYLKEFPPRPEGLPQTIMPLKRRSTPSRRVTLCRALPRSTAQRGRYYRTTTRFRTRTG